MTEQNNDEKSKKWINPEKAIKNMKTVVILFIVIAGIIAFLVQNIVNETTDFRNTTTLSVEIIFGIFISLVVYIYSKKMDNENKKQQKEITKLIEKQSKQLEIQASILKERQLSILGVIQSQITRIHDVIKHIKNLFDLWEVEQNPKTKQDRKNTIVSRLDSMKNYLDVQVISELSQVADRKLKNDYTRLLNKLSLDSTYFDLDSEFPDIIIRHYIEIIDICKELIDSLIEFSKENDLMTD